MDTNYKAVNQAAWNKRTDIHWKSDFYDNDSFIAGHNSLKSIELELLGDLKGKTVLHLQCHFGQDTISLARLGAEKVVGVDLSDRAIARARELAATCQVADDVRFVECDVYDLPEHLDETFDIVFTSYGTIGWLPDMDRWAAVIHKYLRPGGRFVFAEFHPVVWMFDDSFSHVGYDYFNTGALYETHEGTYTDGDQSMTANYVEWNHGLGEVLTSLLGQGLRIDTFSEFDYSPYPCFDEVVEVSPGRYRIAKLDKLIPMVYALSATKV